METEKPRLISFPRINDPRGNLSFIQDKDQAPFEIKRVEWIYDFPADSNILPRAYRYKHQLIFPLAGAIEVIVSGQDNTTSTFNLFKAYQGLYIPAGYTVTIHCRATNSVIVILSSTIDDPDSPDTLF